MMPTPRAILFDLDDTILKFGDRHQLGIAVAQEYSAFLGHLKATEVGDAVEAFTQDFWASEENLRLWRYKMFEARVFIVENTFQILYDKAPALTSEVARQFGKRLHELRDGDVACYPGALATLDEFRRRGVLLALVTNG